MAEKKVSESRQIMDEFTRLNADLCGIRGNGTDCGCSYPRNQLLLAYKLQDIVDKAAAFTDPMVFALEYHERGSRVFLATSRTHFVHFMMKVRSNKPQYTTWHEIVADLCPVNLYFDLEFYTQYNPHVDGTAMMTSFKERLLEFLRSETVGRILFAKGSADSGGTLHADFVELDATTALKFSRHLIVHLRNFAFERVEDVRRFVDFFAHVEKLTENFRVTDKNGRADTCLADFSVYHPWQNLRMLGSPKFGRTNTLVYAKDSAVVIAEDFAALNDYADVKDFGVAEESASAKNNVVQDSSSAKDSASAESDHDFRFHENCDHCADILLKSLATAVPFPAADTICEFTEDLVRIFLFAGRGLVEKFASKLFPSMEEENYKFQFLMRGFACLLAEIYRLGAADNFRNLGIIQSALSLLVEKLTDIKTFFDLQMENTQWCRCLLKFEQIFREFEQCIRHDFCSGEILRYEFVKLRILLDDANFSVPRNEEEISDDAKIRNAEESAKRTATAFQTLPKKCRQNLSYLLRFLRKFEEDMQTNSESIDFSAINIQYRKFLQHVPNSLKSSHKFPAELNADQFADIRKLCRELSELETGVRAERAERIRATERAEAERRRARNEAEMRFRESLAGKIGEIGHANKWDEDCRKLAILVLEHSEKLKLNI